MKDAYHKHHMEILFMDSVEELHEYLKGILHSQKTVSVGGSQTLFETGVIDLLKNSDVKFDNRYEEGLTPEEIVGCIIHLIAYVGFPSALNALKVAQKVFKEQGITVSTPEI